MFTAESDDQIMLKIAKGDQKAFAQLFDRHGRRILGFCSRLMGSRSLGEDQAQEVWLKVVRQAPHYRGEGKFMAWLMTIARTTCLSALRRGNSKFEDLGFEEDEALELSSSEDSALDRLQSVEQIEKVKRAIEALPANQRTVLTLWMAEETSYEELALKLNFTEAAVKSLLFRAKLSLSKSLAGDE